MNKLNKKFEYAQKALKTIEETIKNAEEADPKFKLNMQNSLRKRFEYSMDCIWKYLKFFLELKHGVIQKSPKSVLGEALRVSILSKGEVELALDMVDDRNETSHVYNEEKATEISQEILKYYEFMSNILKKTNP